MKTFVSKMSGCGRFETRVDRDHLQAVLERRRALRMDQSVTVRLASRAQTYGEKVLLERLIALREHGHASWS